MIRLNGLFHSVADKYTHNPQNGIYSHCESYFVFESGKIQNNCRNVYYVCKFNFVFVGSDFDKTI